MTRLEEATIEIAALLEELRLDYMIIGAAAAGSGGAEGDTRRRCDLCAEPDRLEATVQEFTCRLTLRTANPMETVRRLRLLARWM
jgi:hypothetical protein